MTADLATRPTDLAVPTRAELEKITPADRWHLEDKLGEAQGVLREFNDEELRQWVEVEGQTQREIAKLVGLAFPELPEDTLLILDGNNRYEIARLERKLDAGFIGILWRGLSLSEMHERCLGGNDRRTTKPAERFLRRVRMGDARRKAIKEAVEELGWMISYERAEGALCCTDELEWIWAGGRRPGLNDKAHRLALRRTLETYEAAFGRRGQSRQGNVIKGIGAFWLLYPDADPTRMVKAIEGIDLRNLYEIACGRRADLRLGHLYNGFVDVLRMRYSKGRHKSGRLPERWVSAGGIGSWSEVAAA